MKPLVARDVRPNGNLVGGERGGDGQSIERTNGSNARTKWVCVVDRGEDRCRIRSSYPEDHRAQRRDPAGRVHE